jgi:hypothetical protein
MLIKKEFVKMKKSISFILTAAFFSCAHRKQANLERRKREKQWSWAFEAEDYFYR